MFAPGFRLMTMLAMLLCAATARAQPEARTHIGPALIAESVEPAPGRPTTIALVMRPDPTWHGYWENPGDAGLPTKIAWTLPAGVTAGPLVYPVPQRLVIAGLMNYVYESEYAHLVTLNIPAGLAPGTPLPIRAAIKWLACTPQICVPEEGEVTLNLVVGSGGPDNARRADFDRWRAAIPRPLGAPARFAVTGDTLRLAVPLPASAEIAGDAYFYPLTEGAIDYAAPQAITRNGDALIVEVKAARDAGSLAKIAGVVAIGENRGLALDADKGDVPAAGAPVGTVADGSGGAAGTVALALGGAMLGGLLLNVMPCVFPILSLKALSLARSGGNEGAARREALAYAAGAVLVCAMLGGALLALRAGGDAVGWAFQLQNPGVILILLLLVTAIALNLAGLFELPAITGGGALAAKGGMAGSFWTGALAAFVATPCTGPFMGAALGAALILPPAAALAVFAGLGFGLALPFLLLGFVPALRRMLPRPGAWMDRLRRILSLPMFVTALGLAWLLGRLQGVDGMTLGIAAALLIAIALWAVGRRQAGGRRLVWWPVAPGIAAIAALVFLGSAAPFAAALREEPFSEARLATLQAQGRPVFVYFTADWCLTCKVNERTAIDRDEVARAFAERKIAVLVGDWTRSDPAISRFLAKQGRSGVPLYLFYRPGKPVETLPQVLTPGALVALAG